MMEAPRLNNLDAFRAILGIQDAITCMLRTKALWVDGPENGTENEQSIRGPTDSSTQNETHINLSTGGRYSTFLYLCDNTTHPEHQLHINANSTHKHFRYHAICRCETTTTTLQIQILEFTGPWPFSSTCCFLR